MVDIVRDIGAAPVRIYRTENAATVPPVQEDPDRQLDFRRLAGTDRSRRHRLHIGNLIGANNLNQDTRPKWGQLKAFLARRAKAREGCAISFLQASQTTTEFAAYMYKDLDFVPILLEPDPQESSQLRAVVGEAICQTLRELWFRSCDVFVISNDGGHLADLEKLHQSDPSRQTGLIGFVDGMHGSYRAADWIDKIDLERDVKAFTYPLPRPYLPMRANDFDPVAILGSLDTAADPVHEHLPKQSAAEDIDSDSLAAS